ncbi:hypothetical protein Pcinc_029688 [Petrolisthes cinctipes]|uniref:Uncharacterized protein n=1 Tax=Petrolisthes cinctipes TaxID=88211 RepID=A0AAE1K3M0_PETCI|nr:hypothetical protein Pcinc_029688 [Petrolisthes cinctipes]
MLYKIGGRGEEDGGWGSIIGEGRPADRLLESDSAGTSGLLVRLVAATGGLTPSSLSQRHRVLGGGWWRGGTASSRPPQQPDIALFAHTHLQQVDVYV